jgi:arylsulfatase A-like enzyme
MSSATTRRGFLGTAAAIGAFHKPSLAASRPNLVLILTDQQSNCALSANGNPYISTPAMDSLANEGISFTESYCTYPVCSPARSSLITSRMPHETGVRANDIPIVSGIPTMGEHFRKYGYYTAWGGKWHLPRSMGEAPGFDYLIGGSALGGRMDEPLATAVVKFLTQEPQQPFLLVASFMNPHDICDWIRDHKGSRSYTNEALARFPPVRLNMGVDPDEPEYLQYHRTANYDAMSNSLKISAEWQIDDFRHYLHAYYQLVGDVDRQIGRILFSLRSTGLSPRTLVMLTADHGEGLGSHRWTQKSAFWEETVKVPLIVSGVGVGARGTLDGRSLVSGLDVLTTLCDYAGIPPPDRVRGVSLRSVIEGKSWDRRFVVSELSDFGQKSREGRMLRTRGYKYVVFNGGARPEQLFDLQSDPGEVRNLADERNASAVLKEHRNLLQNWTAETKDDFRFPPGAS